MRKDLKYYLSLYYPVEIRKISEEDGGGFMASIPQLGAKAFRADGETVAEALTNLKKIKKSLFQDYLKEGVPIPEPEKEPESVFSGKFIVRIPSGLHRKLVERARKQNISLNQYVNNLLTYNLPLEAIEYKLEVCFSKIETRLTQTQYVFEHPVLSKYPFLLKESLQKAA